MKRKTKIICTLGPSTDDETVLRELMLSGMNTVRLNFSHGTYEEHSKRIDMVKKLREELNLPIAILLDTKGPEVRTGNFKDGKVFLEKGQVFTLTNKEMVGNKERCTVSYKDLANDVSINARVLIDDGLVEMKVIAINDGDVVCEVLNDGPVSDHKSVNVPDVNLRMDYMSRKDIEDIKFGIEQNVDFVAASFVRSAADVLELRSVLERNGGRGIRIISKIENRQGVNDIDNILNVTDGIMVARGDMGVEIAFEQLPAIQKKLITKCRMLGKRVITATEMLESMISNPRPTRAEISDVANAVYDGTSAIMLSGETAAGKYPVESVRTMAKIAETTEANIHYNKRFHNAEFHIKNAVDAISHSTCGMAIDLDAKAIVACSLSGMTARMVSRFRPPVPIIGLTTDESTWRKLALSWGVIPAICEKFSSTDVLFYTAKKIAEQNLALNKGEKIVITGGNTSGVSGTTNLIKIEDI